MLTPYLNMLRSSRVLQIAFRARMSSVANLGKIGLLRLHQLYDILIIVATKHVKLLVVSTF